MRNLFPLLILFFLGCSQQSELEKAKELSENLIKEIQNKRFDKFNELYSKDFFVSVTEKIWISTFNQMDSELGKIESYQFIDSKFEYIDRQNYIVLLYKIHYTKDTSEWTFTIKMEGGKDIIVGHHIKV